MVWIILCVILLLTALLLFAVKLRLGIVIRGIKPEIFIKVIGKKITVYPSVKRNTDAKSDNPPTDEETEKAIGSVKDFWSENGDSIKSALLRLKKGIVIEEFVFNYKCGFQNAALTAVMFGVVNGIFYNIYAFLDRHFRIKNMHGGIYPDFQEKKKLIELDCILYLTVWDIICIAIALLPVIKNIKNK